MQAGGALSISAGNGAPSALAHLMDYDSDDGPSERRLGAVAEAISALPLEALVDTQRSGANGAAAASGLVAGV